MIITNENNDIIIVIILVTIILLLVRIMIILTLIKVAFNNEIKIDVFTKKLVKYLLDRCSNHNFALIWVCLYFILKVVPEVLCNK